MSPAPERLPERLRDLCRSLSQSSDLRSGVEAAAWACDGVFGFYRVALAFPMRQPGRYCVAAAWGRSPEEELEGYDFSLRAHPLEKTALDGVTLVRLDPMADHEDEVLNRLFRDEGKVEEMAVAVPLDGARGLLVFASRERGRFDEAACRWAEDVALILGPWARAWVGRDAPYALREQYELLLEGALDGIAALVDGEIAYANASFREIFGIGLPRPLPRDLRDLLDPESRAAFSGALKGLGQHLRVLPRMELQAVGPGGRRLQLEVGLQRTAYQGEPAVLVQVHNATERAEREQEVRDASVRTDSLLLNLAHDIRGPLTTVLGYSQLLLDEFSQMDSEGIRDGLGVVRGAGGTIKELVDGLLEYTALGASETAFVTVRMDTLLAGVERELEAGLVRAGAQVDYSHIPPCVKGQAGELARVFRNLLDNAVRYAKPGEPPRILVSCVGDEVGFYVFCVEDNGIGIGPGRAREIFQLFKRGQGGGAGIGLAIAERIVRDHGGRIWAEGEPGRGSRFYFTLPKPAGGGL